jgi:hypothetical protein
MFRTTEDHSCSSYKSNRSQRTPTTTIKLTYEGWEENGTPVTSAQHVRAIG